jgi:hypothetical protein
MANRTFPGCGKTEAVAGAAVEPGAAGAEDVVRVERLPQPAVNAVQAERLPQTERLLPLPLMHRPVLLAADSVAAVAAKAAVSAAAADAADKGCL